uniref:Uncharacterized protein n=1 Tax=Arundo donax TaxID=35708 RepID=A0A0A8YV08_ARUDO
MDLQTKKKLDPRGEPSRRHFFKGLKRHPKACSYLYEDTVATNRVLTRTLGEHTTFF